MHINFRSKIFFRPNFFLGLKIFLDQIFFSRTERNFWGKKYFWTNNFFGSQFCLDQHFFWTKFFFMTKIFSDQNFFSDFFFRTKICFLPKVFSYNFFFPTSPLLNCPCFVFHRVRISLHIW